MWHHMRNKAVFHFHFDIFFLKKENAIRLAICPVELQLHVYPVPNISEVFSSNPIHGEV
jgi:hypothetical protein